MTSSEKATIITRNQDDQEIVTTEYFEYEVQNGQRVSGPHIQYEETTRIVDIDSGEYGGGDYLRSLIANYMRGNGAAGAMPTNHMQEAVLNSRTPLHVHETAKKTVRINGIDITGKEEFDFVL